MRLLCISLFIDRVRGVFDFEVLSHVELRLGAVIPQLDSAQQGRSDSFEILVQEFVEGYPHW